MWLSAQSLVPKITITGNVQHALLDRFTDLFVLKLKLQFIWSHISTRCSILRELQGALANLNATIERNFQTLNHPGLVIGVTDRQQLLFEGNFGWANHESQQPLDPNTLFQIGSISKAFTSIVLLRLQEQGVLSIDDPVERYLPWFKVQSDFDPITLRHLMSHTAGIITGSDATLSPFTETWNLRHTRVNTKPGEFFHYSNSGYKILGLVLQTVLNQALADILTGYILSPLGMAASEPVITNAMRDRLAVGYEAFYDDRPLPCQGKLAPAVWFESDTADGSISSNVVDMCRYLRALLNRCAGLLSPESFDQLIQPHIPTGDKLHGEHYGLGLTLRHMDAHQVIGHSGGMVGYYADTLVDMDQELGIVVLTTGPGDPEKISQYALRFLRAAMNGQELPAFPPQDPNQALSKEACTGVFRCADKEFSLSPKDDHLYLNFEGDSILLEPRGLDTFLVPHPAFELFLLRLERETGPEDKDKARITGAFHGPDWYVNPNFSGETSFATPPEWLAYPGHYRSHNPWYTNFRVVIRCGRLILIYPYGEEENLFPLANDYFRVGEDPRSPEFIHFDLIVAGKAQRANFSGGVYCRMFTP